MSYGLVAPFCQPIQVTPAPPTPVFDPSILSGLTFSAYVAGSTMYTSRTSSSPPPANSGDSVGRIDSDFNIQRVLSDQTGTGQADPRFVTGAFGAGLPSARLYKQGSQAYNDWYTFMQKPAGTANPTVGSGMFDLWSTTQKTLIFAGRVNNCGTNQGGSYNDYNDTIFGSPGWHGIVAFKVQTTTLRIVTFTYLANGNVRKIITNHVFGTPFVLAVRHGDGVLGVSLNNGPWTTITCAASDSNSGVPYLGFPVSASGPDIELAALVTCNATNSDTDIANVVSQAGALVGMNI